MLKKSIFLVVASVVMFALAFTGCSKKNSNTSNSGNNTSSVSTVNTQSIGNNDSLFDISNNEISVTSSLNKDTVLSEIPVEFFKGVGRVNSVDIWADTISSFKYVVVLKFYVNSNQNAVKVLMDYYKSIGATVEETGNRYNPYSVNFEWGEATEVKFDSFEGQDYVDLQFSVVKK